MAAAEIAAPAPNRVVFRQQDFFVLPEFTPPKDGRSDKDKIEVPVPPMTAWKWSEGGVEAMHPFWAVRRLTPSKMEEERVAASKHSRRKPRFNVVLEENFSEMTQTASIRRDAKAWTRLPFFHHVGLIH